MIYCYLISNDMRRRKDIAYWFSQDQRNAIRLIFIAILALSLSVLYRSWCGYDQDL